MEARIMLKIAGFAQLSIQLGTPCADVIPDFRGECTAKDVLAELEYQANTMPIRCCPGLFRAKTPYYPKYRVIYTRNSKGEDVALAIVKRDDDTYDPRQLAKIAQIMRKVQEAK
jgi:hypothetical protein